jgi:chromatin segregation and condensation protein Rec8/ScpA/Scc1 (kleisin family)
VKAAVASTLLACLELAKDRELRVHQREIWGAIAVSRDDSGRRPELKERP